MRPFLLLLLAAAVIPVAAAQFARHTTGPSIVSGNPQVDSGNVTLDTGLDPLASAVSSSVNYRNRFGYVGQLTDVTAFAVVGPASVAENSFFSVAATASLDDGTQVVPGPTTITWSVVSGPVYVDDPDGTVGTDPVYQNAGATVRGAYRGFTDELTVTILNVGTDDFGTYAGDGLPDSWQVAHFGEGNVLAAPTADPDGDGQNNRLEFLAGTDPLLGTSVFTVRIDHIAGQPSHKAITFGPITTGRTYRVFATTDLAAASWTDLSGPLTGASASRTFTDTAASGARKFYHVQISNP